MVRTESHLARFNTARAMFEKMGQIETTSDDTADKYFGKENKHELNSS